MEIVKDSITSNELKQMAAKMFGNLVKAVVDIEKEQNLISNFKFLISIEF